jgi:hypothetical protein
MGKDVLITGKTTDTIQGERLLRALQMAKELKDKREAAGRK